jgi:hypothetical protein
MGSGIETPDKNGLKQDNFEFKVLKLNAYITQHTRKQTGRPQSVA